MHSTPSVDRRAVVAAWLALLSCVALGFVQSSIWNGPDAPPWIALVGQWLGLGGVAASSFDQPPAQYFTYGRLFMFVYAALAFTLARAPLGAATSGPSDAVSGASSPPPSSRLLHRAITVALAVAMFGDVLAYWLSAYFGPALRQLGFWRIEVPALAALLLLLTVEGVARIRQGRSRRVAWPFAVVIPGALVSVAALRYMPHGLVLPIAVAVLLHARRPSASPASSPRLRRILRGAAVSLVAAVSLGAVALPYRPLIVHGEPAPAGPYATPTPVEGVRLHVFNTGMNRMSELLVGERRPWRGVPAFVIEHPRHGLIVFDCGISAAVAERGEAALPKPMPWLFESRGRPGLTLAAQMIEAGLDPSRVRRVVISHLHEDHVGDAAHFSAATFFGGPGTAGRLEGSLLTWQPVLAVAPFAPFAGAQDLLGDGSVQLVLGGGHAREDVMAFVGLPEGPVLLAGDAVVHHDWLESDDVERIAVDANRAAAVRNRIRAMLAADERLLLIPGHDLRKLPQRDDIVLHHPERFVPDAWPVTD
ncbi:MBL fold metallo-hydrolase [Haliangium sp.]|uniref:MBL fold metallo-hydrolase n=1 Tax=Haliangium sp. TaxID=2663208 RepID=UPI003D0FD6D9